MRIFLIFFYLFCFFFSFPAESSLGPFAYNSLSGAMEGMGGPLTSLKKGPESLLVNPAGISPENKREYMLSHSFDQLNITNGASSSSFNLNGPYTVAAGFYTRYTPIEELPEPESPTENKYSENVFAAGVAAELGPDIKAGLACRYASKKYHPFYAGGFFADVGVHMRLFDGWFAGYTFKNILNTGFAGGSFFEEKSRVKEKTARALSVGISRESYFSLDLLKEEKKREDNDREQLQTLDMKFTAAANALINFEESSFSQYNIGAELIARDLVGIRAGLNNLQGVSAGLRVWKIDYAYFPAGSSGYSHLLSLKFK